MEEWNTSLTLFAANYVFCTFCEKNWRKHILTIRQKSRGEIKKYKKMWIPLSNNMKLRILFAPMFGCSSTMVTSLAVLRINASSRRQPRWLTSAASSSLTSGDSIGARCTFLPRWSTPAARFMRDESNAASLNSWNLCLDQLMNFAHKCIFALVYFFPEKIGCMAYLKKTQYIANFKTNCCKIRQ